MPTTITIANLHPTSDLDPYALEFLLDPYPFHEQLRNAGSVVWLKPSIILEVDPPVHTRSRARRTCLPQVTARSRTTRVGSPTSSTRADRADSPGWTPAPGSRR